jgi:hypothetical protein
MLEAHEALASLSERNRQEFVHLIEHLRAEVDRLEAAGDDKQADT